jgi:hypothetical protein
MYINKNNKNEISTFWSHVLIPGIEFVNNFLCCFISGGFYHSDLLLRHIISAYVPFLPLEQHAGCIFVIELAYWNKSQQVVDMLFHSDTMSWF